MNLANPKRLRWVHLRLLKGIHGCLYQDGSNLPQILTTQVRFGSFFSRHNNLTTLKDLIEASTTSSIYAWKMTYGLSYCQYRIDFVTSKYLWQSCRIATSLVKMNTIYKRHNIYTCKSRYKYKRLYICIRLYICTRLYIYVRLYV